MKDTESRKNEIATRLAQLAREESELLINRPLDGPEMTWTEYLKQTDEIDAERKKLRKELFDLYMNPGRIQSTRGRL